MFEKYTKEEFWKLFEKLSEELQDTIFSVETADSVHDICKRNQIEETFKVANLIGYVLLGVLPPEELQETLKKELGLEPGVAKKVSQEIDRFILHPVRTSLANLYKTEGSPPATKSEVIPPTEKKPTPPKKEDTYRERVEEEE